MRAVVQRVEEAKITVEGSVVGAIHRGLLVYLGVERDDTDDDLGYIVRKVAGVRVFPDDEGVMNRSLESVVGGAILAVSQFTLLGDTRKGRRPSYNRAADPADARRYYELAVEQWRAQGFIVETGQFQTEMRVSYTNAGPVTILMDSRKTF